MNDEIEKLKAALAHEREAHKKSREELNDKLRVVTGKLDEAKRQVSEAGIASNPAAENIRAHVESVVAARLAEATAAQQGKIVELEAKLGEANKATDAVKATLAGRTIEHTLRNAAMAEHVLPAAIDDVLALGHNELALDADGTTVKAKDGRSVAEFFADLKQRSPYYWPLSRGSGTKGSGQPELSSILGTNSDNPFDRKSSAFNLTAASRIMRENPQQAAKLQKAAA